MLAPSSPSVWLGWGCFNLVEAIWDKFLISLPFSRISDFELLININTLDDLRMKALRNFSSKTYGHVKNQMTLNCENITQSFLVSFVCRFVYFFVLYFVFFYAIIPPLPHHDWFCFSISPEWVHLMFLNFIFEKKMDFLKVAANARCVGIHSDPHTGILRKLD